jgi:lysophospholipase L1-like esterase
MVEPISYVNMRVSRLVWIRPLMLAASLGLAACDGSDSTPTSPTPPSPPAAFYTALGASDAIGIGASVPCLPFAPCPNGTGYVPVIVRGLDDDRAVTLTNLGIPTAVIGPHFEALGRRYGRDPLGNFLDREVPLVPRNTTMVTIFAGGNDSNTVGAAIRGGAGGSNPVGFIRAQVAEFRSAYGAVIRGVRERAGSARIVVANLPNYAGIPLGRTFTPAERQAVQLISVGFSVDAINRLTSQGVLVVDLLCDPRFYEPGNYSDDGFHMSDGGYAIMAEEMLSALKTGSYPSPSSSCPEMTIVPNP